MSNETLALTVSNTGFLLDRLGQDCAPLQFVRELTQNAIQAIQRANLSEGRIVWDLDRVNYEARGTYKLSITDNGDGMPGEDMVRYINSLSSSGSTQAIDGNYGVGAKIAAATRNHEGLVYLSWREGRGSMIHLWRDPETRQYGLRQIPRPDGTFGHYAEVSDDVKPDFIEGAGTKVVLLGNTPDANTTIAPEGYTARDRWIVKYLNTRYFRIPEHIKITAREGMEHASKGGGRGNLRRIYGQAWFLANHSLHSGAVALDGARAHWWIVKEQKDLVTEGPSFETSGHVATLYQDELYELLTQRAGKAKLQEFGIIFATNRVVIYIEPTADAGQVTTNTARTRLILDGEDLPWSDWAAEFREKMPAEIRELMDEVGAKAQQNDHEKAIRDRLKPLLDLYKVSRYRLEPNGASNVDEQALTPGGESDAKGTTPPTRTRTGKRGQRAGAAGGAYGNFLKNNGTPAKAIHPDVFPHVKWVSVKDGSREPDQIEDRAARFHSRDNLLMINADFRVFNDLVERWAREFEGHPAARDVCQDVVRGWFEQTLIEAVIGIQALKDSKEWSIAQVQSALSEEALTMAVMPRYHINFSAKRDIGSKLGKLG